MKYLNIILYILLVPFEAMSSVLFATLLQPVIDTGINKNTEAFIQMFSLLFIVSIGNLVLNYATGYFFIKVIANNKASLKNTYLTAILNKKPSEFYKKDTGYYVTKITVDSEAIAEKYYASIMKMYRIAWSFILSVIAIIRVDWKIAIIVLVFAMLSASIPKMFQKSATIAEENYLYSNNVMISRTQNLLQCYLLIKAYHLYKDSKQKFMQTSSQLEQHTIKREEKELFINNMSLGLTQISFLVIIGVCVILILYNVISVGYVMSVTQLLGSVMAPFELLPVYLLCYKTGKEIDKKNKVEFEVTKEKEGKDIPQKSNSVLSVNNVCFSYENEKALLNHISMELDLGKKYAIVGESGSGKTTLVKLLAGFLPHSSGNIYINGTPLEDVKEEQFYRMISYQEQQIALFHDTLEYNITLGTTITEETWNYVLEQAQLKQLISGLPDGKHTIIEEGGKNLSGGEAQRIGVARCLANKKAFVIYDEIVASLDNETALEIEKTILTQDKMGVLMVTHRIHPQTMKLYDTIFVMEQGKIVECRTFSQLMEKKGKFYLLATIVHEK